MPPINFPVPPTFSDYRNWKIKIQDGEPDYEAPHVTISGHNGGRKMWRINIRELANSKWVVMDLNPPPGNIPKEVRDHIEAMTIQLVQQWNQKYPGNPV